MATECHNLYYSDLARAKLLPKRGIFLDKVEEKLLGFHSRIIDTGWICFDPDPFFANNQWVCEFYTNLSVVSITNPMMTIWGKDVHLRAEQINEIYRLSDADVA